MKIEHSAELRIHKYIEDVRKGKRGMSDATISRVANDVTESLRKQFNQNERKFSLRMSSIGRPVCQQWYEKNDPDGAVEFSANFLMNMLMGDIVEAVFKGILTEAGIDFSDGFKSTLKTPHGDVQGTHDLIMNKRVDDIKSASPWSYTNKFKDYETLKDNDSFGYVGQLAGYAKALSVDPGGWWVINKANGEFKYIAADDMDLDEELEKINETVKTLKDNKFKKCFDAVPETFRKKETGNKILGMECGWCKYRYKCWPTLQERASLVSQAKEPPIVPYIEIADKYVEKCAESDTDIDQD